jgi:hypothetical protein
MNVPARSLICSAAIQTRSERGRAAYEADVRSRPTYHDGTPRKSWDRLGEIERWSWNRSVDSPDAVSVSSISCRTDGGRV